MRSLFSAACLAAAGFAAICAADDSGAPACPPANHSCYTTGGPGCTNLVCCETVCAVDPFCCNNSWDSACVNEAISMCACPTSTHNCFTTGGAGCTNLTCCDTVCAADPFCCSNSWDSVCVNEASSMCDGCGDPAAGDCCASHDTPFCNQRTCCDLVCAIDSFCCNNHWDSVCVGEAADFPACGCACGKVDFGVTVDDFGNTNACGAAGNTPLNTQYVFRRSIVFGAATDLGTPPAVIVGDTACDPSCRSAGDPPYATDWWCQFRIPLAPGAPGAVAGVTAFSASLCFIDAPPGTELMQGFDRYGNLIAAGASTINGDETIAISAPPGDLITYVKVVASNPVRVAGVSVDCLEYDTPVAVLVCPDSDHSCFTTGGPGCSNTDCCETVCSIDPFCCTNSWDGLCKDQANALCGGCGSADGGSCFCSHSNVGCDDSSCCRVVCEIDAFCCSVSWDSICANEANQMCGCRLDFNNDGQVDGGDLGQLLAAWSTSTCPFDVNGDGIVNGGDLGLLLAAWGACP